MFKIKNKEYARLYLNNEMQIFIDAEDSLDL